jgi:protein-disulfide isomerase
MTAKVKRVKRAGMESAEAPIINGWLVGGAVAGLLFLAFLLFLAVREPEIVTIPGYCRDNPDHCLATGPEDAPITFIEVSDYGCRTCLQFYVETAPYLDEWYLQNGYMRWLIVPHGNPAQPETAAAAEAAFCAAEQDNFFEYHINAFRLQIESFGLSEVGFLNSARQADMNIGEMTRCLDSDKYVPFVEANTAAVQAADLDTKPTFYINEFPIEGAQSYAVFQQRMDRLID